MFEQPSPFRPPFLTSGLPIIGMPQIKRETCWVIEKATGNKVHIKSFRFNPALHTRLDGSSQAPVKSNEKAIDLSDPVEAPKVEEPVKRTRRTKAQMASTEADSKS